MSSMIAAIICLVSFVFLTWAIVCVIHTSRTRTALIAWLLTLEKARIHEGLEYNEDFLRPIGRVSFDCHFVYLFTFRNPMRLYDR
jgi:hypothetical protein